jgi:hypothetical protein
VCLGHRVDQRRFSRNAAHVRRRRVRDAKMRSTAPFTELHS